MFVGEAHIESSFAFIELKCDFILCASATTNIVISFKWPQPCCVWGKQLSRLMETVAEESALKLALLGP